MYNFKSSSTRIQSNKTNQKESLIIHFKNNIFYSEGQRKRTVGTLSHYVFDAFTMASQKTFCQIGIFFVILHRRSPEAMTGMRVGNRTYKKDVVTAFICGRWISQIH